MDELAIASGLLTLVFTAFAIIAGLGAMPMWFNRLMVIFVAFAVLCTTVNGGIALGHMLGWVSR